MKDMRDIERDRDEEERKKMKKKISDDIIEVTEDISNRMEDFFRRKNIEQELRYKKQPIFLRAVKRGLWWIFCIGLLLLLLNFILGNVWLFRALIKSLFLG